MRPMSRMNVYYGEQQQFGVYVPTAEEMEKRRAQLGEPAGALNIHYNADGEIRDRGAAAYKFSKEEEHRQKEMNELLARRETTKRMRSRNNAVDAETRAPEAAPSDKAPVPERAGASVGDEAKEELAPVRKKLKFKK